MESDRAKRIYIAADDHTDYFWSGDEDAYRQAFLEMLDYYLDLADKTEHEPTQFQSRWNCDGSYWIWTYENNRSQGEFSRLMQRVKDGHISFPLNPLVVSLGGAPAEAVLRGMYYAGSLERRYHIKVPLAISMENQAQPYGLGSLWEGAGAKYSWKGICGCDSRIHDAWDRENEIYWMGSSGDSRILMKWNSMLGNNQNIGGYAEARNPAQVLEYVDKDLRFRSRYPYDVIGAFGKGWDDLKTMTDEFVRVAKANSTPDRNVSVSNMVDFFKDFEKTHGMEIPVQSCSFGNEWDLYCASLAEVSARVKRVVEKLRGAEALATIVSLRDRHFMDGREISRDKAWMNLGLFWEHNFGMVNPQTGNEGVKKRINWQRQLVSEIETYVDTLGKDAIEKFGGMIEHSRAYSRFFIFNPLNWQRSDVAELPYAGPFPVHVLDLTTGEELPSQIIQLADHSRLRILAKNLPALGYKVVEVRPGPGQVFAKAASVQNNVIENEYYRITLSGRGAIISLIEKGLKEREWVKVINGRALNDLGPGPGTIEVEEAGPVSVTLLARSPKPVNHISRLRLFGGLRRIDIRNEIVQNFSDTVTWGFGFNTEAPMVRHEEVGAVVTARYLEQGGHYSPRNARYDWLTLNHFADITDGENTLGITLSNADCYFMKLGNSSVAELDSKTPLISVLAGGRVVNGENGLPNQGGDAYFFQRFALQPHGAYDPAEAMRFSLEHQNPLITGPITGGGAYPPDQYSFFTFLSPDLILWALKPADDGIGQGIVARLWNLSSDPVHFSVLSSSDEIAGLWDITHIETPLNELPVSDGRPKGSIKGEQLKSFLIKTVLSRAATIN